MKPTAPLRENLSGFATTPCRALSTFSCTRLYARSWLQSAGWLSLVSLDRPEWRNVPS